MTAIDLFCGAGGLSVGLMQAGIEVLLGVDHDPVALSVYARNVSGRTLCWDLSNLPGRLPHADVIVGGTPCQDYSPAGLRVEGRRARLTVAFANIVLAIRPAWVVVENVPRAAMSVAYADAVSLLCPHYSLTQVMVNAASVEVPQTRRRLLLLGRLGGGSRPLVLHPERPRPPLTVREVLGSRFAVEHYYYHPRYPGRRGIYGVDEPAPTIIGRSRPLPPSYRPHPRDSTTDLSRVRALTPLEASLIQGFPEWWDWGGVPARDAWRLLGNAVPPPLAEHIGRVLLDEMSLRPDSAGRCS